MHDEFITGGRTDNITGTYTVFKALVKSLENENRLKLDENIRVAATFDSEEASA